MSFDYYSKWWAGTKQNLEKLVAKDASLTQKPKAVKKRSLANQLIGGLYAKYSMIVQDLGLILDQMAQPQKRVTVRRIMDAATARLFELNEELRTIDISEYHYIDGALIELKLIPQDVEILDPILYFLRDNTVEDLWTKIKNGERIYTAPPPPPPPPEEKSSRSKINLTLSKNILDGKSSKSRVKIQEPTEAAQPEEPHQETLAEKKEKIKKRPKKFVLEVKQLSAEEQAEIEKKQRSAGVLRLIQTQERARQARLYFNEKEAQHKFKKQLREGIKPTILEPEVQANATLQMQKLWRGHCARQFIRRKERERRSLIGMTEPSWRSYAEFEKLEQNLQKRRDYRDQRIKEYIEANLNERVRVFQVIGPSLMEDIGDEIREWFYQWYKQAKNFDKYPPEEKGGTVLVVRGETLTPREWIEQVEKKRKERRKGKDKAKEKAEKAKKKKQEAEKKKKEKEEKKKEMLRKKKKRMKPYDYDMEFEPTLAKEPMDKAFEEYYRMWHERKDIDNPLEKHYMDIIHEEKCYEMQLELRRIVDELMRLELEMLEDALERDRAKKKGKKAKKKKKKKPKKKRGKRGKKDPTGHRTLEDLFQELVDNGIIHPYEKAYLKDYKGDYSYNSWELRNREFDPPQCLGDVKQVVKINCIAPLSTDGMKKPRSVLLMGPKQTGKHILAHAVLTESQSVLFDLSPEILEGKYEGKKGMKMLLHLINKMARLLQPSVIYFERAERLFYKKVPKEEKHLDPRRMGKKLLKGIVKTIKPPDRVMVFGLSSEPWLGKPAKIKKTFERIILIPRPDYGSIYLYWRELLMPYHGVDRNFNVSSLAKVTKNFTFPAIKQAVDTVFTARRIVELYHKPLQAAELYEVLIEANPISDKEFNKFLKLYKKTQLGKERAIYNKFAERTREQEAKAKEKQQQKQAQKK